MVYVRVSVEREQRRVRITLKKVNGHTGEVEGTDTSAHAERLAVAVRVHVQADVFGGLAHRQRTSANKKTNKKTISRRRNNEI